MTDARNILKAINPKDKNEPAKVEEPVTEEVDEDGIDEGSIDEPVTFGGNAEPLSEDEYLEIEEVQSEADEVQGDES